MLLLHISDIHFKDPICHTEMDPNLPYRTALIRDVEKRARELGEVQAILVTGDVAFRGISPEYDAALAWLKKLAAAGGCQLENIFVVPGNHDVDRNVISSKANVRNAHRAVLQLRSDPRHRDQEFLTQFSDPEVRKVLLEPLQSYNEFAAKFDCQLYLPERLFWTKNRRLNDSFVLKIYGLTSTMFSGASGGDDLMNSLYLSPYQIAFNTDAGVISLAMCHHPPEWFIDYDAIDEALRDRVAIHLFGHKHRQRATKDDRCVGFSASAVNPDLYEPRWEPGYNLINLTVNYKEGRYFLEIEAHVMIWQNSPGLFRLKEYQGGDTVFRHKISVGEPPAARKLTSQKDQLDNNLKKETTGGHGEGIVTSPVETEGEMGDEGTDNLVFRFWELSSSERREITHRLGLIDETDMRLPEPERYGRAFIRAKKRGLVERLADEIAGMERR